MDDDDIFLFVAERIADQVTVTETDDGVTVDFGRLPIEPVELPGLENLFFV